MNIKLSIRAFRRGNREIDEHAVARQKSVVFDDPLWKITFFHVIIILFTEFDDFLHGVPCFLNDSEFRDPEAVAPQINKNLCFYT